MHFLISKQGENNGMNSNGSYFSLSAACVLLSAFFAWNTYPACAQQTIERAHKVQIELVAEKTAVKPGETITLALRQQITPGWHTYWMNPGDSGEPTRIEWELPAGASAGPIQWPIPEAIPVGPLMNFGYSDEVLLLSDITIPENISGPVIEIAGKVKWLVCEEICIPESAGASLRLPLIDERISPLPSPYASMIAKARAQTPEPKPWPARFDIRGGDIAMEIEQAGSALPSEGKIRFFPLEWGQINHAAPQQAGRRGETLVLSLAAGELIGEKKPVAIEGVLTIETRAANGTLERSGYSISAAPAALEVPASPPASAIVGEEGNSGLSLFVALGFAFLGGLILNLMPCVFPVLSLKALSLAKDAGDPAARRLKGVFYLAGVLASFALIGALLVVLQAGGTGIGWGMQFQSPAFVLTMMALFLALGLNLSGVFTFGGGIVGVGDGLTRRPGVEGYFFTGVLATVVATPCTAPFMGAAMGYAFTQPVPVVFAVLLALGFGFALPIVLLSLTPAFGRWLPKPGPWMVTFKQLMAFPLYATAGWLLWVLSVQQGSEGVLAGVVTLVGVAFAAWLFGRGGDSSLVRDNAAAVIAVLSIGLGAWTLGEEAAPLQARDSKTETSGPKYEAFTQARLDQLLAQTQPVFVNLTAAWCITCKVNERMALHSEDVAAAFKDRGVVYLVGDWTNGNPEITALLKAHGRVGVPLYLLFHGEIGAKPDILPQILTESIIMDRLASLSQNPMKQAKGAY